MFASGSSGLASIGRVFFWFAFSMPSPSLRFLLLGGLVVATQALICATDRPTTAGTILERVVTQVASYENDLGAAGKQPPPPPLKGR
jgi:hypothetical protein